MERFKMWVYFNGFRAGIFLIIAPIAWDVFMLGGRNALVWAVGCTGMAVQVVGLILIFCGGRNAK